MQLLPVARMRDGLDDAEGGGGWRVLADLLVIDDDDDDGKASITPTTASLPFAVFAERLRPEMSASDLRAAYIRLYRRACASASAGRPPPEEEDGGVEAQISYNLAMTRKAMVLCPRTAEGGDVVAATRRGGSEEGKEEVGKLALNGTVLAGTALVKSRDEWDALRADGGQQLWDILGGIGVSPSLLPPPPPGKM